MSQDQRENDVNIDIRIVIVLHYGEPYTKHHYHHLPGIVWLVRLVRIDLYIKMTRIHHYSQSCFRCTTTKIPPESYKRNMIIPNRDCFFFKGKKSRNHSWYSTNIIRFYCPLKLTFDLHQNLVLMLVEVRQKYFEERFLYSLFRNVNPEKILTSWKRLVCYIKYEVCWSKFCVKTYSNCAVEILTFRRNNVSFFFF